MELECSEGAGTNGSETVEERVLLQEGASLSANEVQEWRFRLPVPEVLKPSLAISQTSVVWRVKGILARSRRADFQVEQVVQVYTGL